MMKVITGKMFSTSLGKMIVHNKQLEEFAVGDNIFFDGNVYIIKGIIPPTNPEGKWSLSV